MRAFCILHRMPFSKATIGETAALMPGGCPATEASPAKAKWLEHRAYLPKLSMLRSSRLLRVPKNKSQADTISIVEDFLNFQPSDLSGKTHVVLNPLKIKIEPTQISNLRRSFPIS